MNINKMCKTIDVYGIIFLISSFGLYKISAQNASAKNTAAFAAPRKAAQPNGLVSSYFQQNAFGPNTYAFGYEVNDKLTGNVQFRDEQRYLNGTVQGSYGYVRPDGRMTITHYHSDKKSGFLTYTNDFAVGERPKYSTKWPISSNESIFENNENQFHTTAAYDEKSHLNLTENSLPNVQQHNLDINLNNSSTANGQSTLAKLLNGEVPILSGKLNADNDAVDVKEVHNFLPADFPLTPFEIPEKLLDKQNENGSMAVQQKGIEKIHSTSTNDHLKSVTTEESASTTTAKLQTPLPLEDTSASANNSLWYKKIIADNRKEFLENLPNLN